MKNTLQATFPSLLFFSFLLLTSWHPAKTGLLGGNLRDRLRDRLYDIDTVASKLTNLYSEHPEEYPKQELDINRERYTTLQAACLTRDVAIVGEVLERNHSIINKAIDQKQNTPLLIACGAINDIMSPEIVILLIHSGADVNAKNLDGNTALHMVSTCHCKQTASSLISLLTKHGADVNAQNTNLVTPLHNTCGGHYACAARTLLAHGAKTDIANVWGNTPWNCAVENDNHAVIAEMERYEKRKLGPPPVKEAAAIPDTDSKDSDLKLATAQLRRLSIQSPVDAAACEDSDAAYEIVDRPGDLPGDLAERYPKPSRFSSCTIS